jgi:putative methionine-R-sulfoxide reductase with GAF domain
MSSSLRDYQSMASKVRPGALREVTMQAVVEALWSGLRDCGISWVGFYLDQPDQPDDRRLVLGPCRDKPACSPIGLHGVCGQALRNRSIRIVKDVRDLGNDYVACDPRDRSEIVIPLFEVSGNCWGVLDLDSWTVGSFNAHDAAGLKRVLAAAGLA